MSDLADKARILIDVLSRDEVNVLQVRNICRENAGLIASAGLRLKTWSVLLLGSQASNLSESFSFPSRECAEQHVLEADVPRTRAEVVALKSPDMRNAIHAILQKFCVDHDIQYKQGMNEVSRRQSLVHCMQFA